MYAAGRLEAMNVSQYVAALEMARTLGMTTFAEQLEAMRAEEDRHERFFGDEVRNHPLLPVTRALFGWSPPPEVDPGPVPEPGARRVMNVPITCSLGEQARARRVEDWRTAATFVVAREPVDGGLRLGLRAEAPLGSLAELAAAEQACCPFFAFSLTIDARGPALEVRALAEGLAMVESLFGPST